MYFSALPVAQNSVTMLFSVTFKSSLETRTSASSQLREEQALLDVTFPGSSVPHLQLDPGKLIEVIRKKRVSQAPVKNRYTVVSNSPYVGREFWVRQDFSEWKCATSARKISPKLSFLGKKPDEPDGLQGCRRRRPSAHKIVYVQGYKTYRK